MSYEFQLASDIHIEKKFPEKPGICDFITPCCKTLILAGDIGSIYFDDQLQHFFKTCMDQFQTVIYVPGNNEYYSREGFEPVSFDVLNKKLAQLCKDCGVILLVNSCIETDDLIIFGSTWWSFIPDQLNLRIKIGDHQITADEFNCMHYMAKISLSRVLESRGSKKVLVITHYCPTTIGTMNLHHKRDEFKALIPYYFADSEKFLQSGIVNTWIFGHTHVFRDMFFETTESSMATRILSNADPRKRFFRTNFTFTV
jgi:predicted phosphodiesterase